MSDRRTIPATCTVHGAQGFCNLLVSKDGGAIRIDPHTTGACVITLGEDGAVTMRDALIEWLG